MYEASMNFDMEDVQPFLEQVENNLGVQMPIAELMHLASTIEVEDEAQRTFELTFNGNQTKVTCTVFMDDVDAPDLFFHTPDESLAKALEAEMERFMEDNDL